MERSRLDGAERIEVVFVLESQFNGLEFLRRTGGEIGDGTVLDFSVLAEGLA